jgi:hypothetical protein
MPGYQIDPGTAATRDSFTIRRADLWPAWQGRGDSMPEHDSSGDLIAAIYDAIIDPSRWGEVVKRIVTSTKSRSGGLITYYLRGQCGECIGIMQYRSRLRRCIRSTISVLLLTGDCRVVFANPRAEDLVRRGTGLRYERGRRASLV